MDRQSGNIRYSRSFRDWVRRHRWILALSAIALLAGGAAWAGAFIFSGEFYGPDVILHPAGYTGTQSVLNVNVCINEDTPLPAGATIAQMVTSIKNNIAIWNQLQPITGNALQGSANDLAWNQIDFESVALHELGHCIGLAHVNAASESGLPSGPNQNYTKATDGSNGLDLNPGSDGVIGSFDDIRGDDVNLHWFRMDTNDPGQLPLPVPVDGTTYDRDQSSLPTGHTFAANLDRTVAGTLGHTNTSTVKTEAVMQQVSYYDEDQRRLTADGAASILLAASGFDLIAGTADDYVLNLIYGGVVPPDSCDTMVQFTGMGGLANCQIGAYIVNSTHFRISTGDMNFGLGYNWYFNPRGPCRQTTNLTNGQWRQIALSCDPGTSNTVADVFGDDLTGTYGTNWIVHERNGGGYTALGLGDALQVGPGYWILTNQANQTVNIEGRVQRGCRLRAAVRPGRQVQSGRAPLLVRSSLGRCAGVRRRQRADAGPGRPRRRLSGPRPAHQRLRHVKNRLQVEWRGLRSLRRRDAGHGGDTGELRRVLRQSLSGRHLTAHP